MPLSFRWTESVPTVLHPPFPENREVFGKAAVGLGPGGEKKKVQSAQQRGRSHLLFFNNILDRFSCLFRWRPVLQIHSNNTLQNSIKSSPGHVPNHVEYEHMSSPAKKTYSSTHLNLSSLIFDCFLITRGLCNCNYGGWHSNSGAPISSSPYTRTVGEVMIREHT
jgi:hypothetical protein